MYRIGTFRFVFANLTRKEVILIDQQGNIIGGRPIRVPDEVDNAPEEKREAIFQIWLNGVRRELKIKYPTINFDVDPERKNNERPELYSNRLFLKDLPAEKTYLDVVLENTASRREFARDVFPKTNLPLGLQRLLVALPAVESAYDTTLIHPETKATGAWQIMEELGRELGIVGKITRFRRRLVRQRRKRKWIREPYRIPFDYRKDFEVSTRVIAQYFSRLYEQLRNNPDIKKIMHTYRLSEEHFIYPLVLDAYHAGVTRTVLGSQRKESMVQWFLKTYSPEKVKQAIGAPPYGRDIYTLMSNEYMKSGGDRRYFRASRDYFAKVSAMADLLENPERVELSGEYQPPEAEIVEQVFEKEPVPSRIPKDALVAAVVGTSVFTLIDELRGRLTRRKFLISTGGNFAAGALGFALGVAPQEEVGITKPLDIKKPLPEEWLEKLEYDPEMIENLRGKFELAVPLLTEDERRAIRRMKNPDLRYWMQQRGIHLGLTSIGSLEELEERHSILRQLKEKALGYRLRGVGNIDGGLQNNMEYARIHPSAERMVEELSNEVNRAAHAQDLPQQYLVRLIITGAARTEAYQKRLKKSNPHASDWSSHTYLNSLDLASTRFDIIDTEAGKFGMVHGNSEINRETRFSEKLQAILGRVVMEKMEEGKIMAFREGGAQPCYHIMCIDL